MIEVSKKNAIEAGLADLVTWKQMQVKDLFIRKEFGYIIGNPPYGERIGDKDAVAKIYEDLGSIMVDHPTWSVYMLTAFKDFEKQYGQKDRKSTRLNSSHVAISYAVFCL